MSPNHTKFAIAVAGVTLCLATPLQPEQTSSQSQPATFKVAPDYALSQLIIPEDFPKWSSTSGPAMGAFEIFVDASGRTTDVRPFPGVSEKEILALTSVAKQLSFRPVAYQGAPVPFVSVLAVCSDVENGTLPCAPKLNANGGVDDPTPQRIRFTGCDDPNTWEDCNRRASNKAKASGVRVPHPIRVSGINPVYPAEAKAAHITGTVLVRAAISTAGKVLSTRVLGGPPMLYSSATDSIKTWKFKPLTWNGVPVETEANIAIRYDLRLTSMNGLQSF